MTYGTYNLPEGTGIGVEIHQQCVGIKSNGARCSEVSPTDPPYPEHPNWPYLCPFCANEAPRRGSSNTKGIVEEKPLTSNSIFVNIFK